MFFFCLKFLNAKDAIIKDERRQPLGAAERRSAQQIERDSQRQKSFEARRAASHPQLAYDEDEIKTEITPDHRPQPQIAPIPVRRGSHGNLMGTTVSNHDTEKDSDDGGFLHRNNSNERRLDDKQKPLPSETTTAQPTATTITTTALTGNHVGADTTISDTKMTDVLQGTPRKRLEGEIGKIEGVYNVGQRTKTNNEDDVTRNGKKNAPGSAASSDYDKTGGQSSSNADSGRGSAAYSSGRRPGGIDLNGDTCDTGQLPIISNYRDLHNGGGMNRFPNY